MHADYVMCIPLVDKLADTVVSTSLRIYIADSDEVENLQSKVKLKGMKY